MSSSSEVQIPIFMDNQSTTRVDPRVVEAMLPFFTENYGNSASRNHVFGCTAESAVENARAQVAALIGGDPKEIVWTSGDQLTRRPDPGDPDRRAEGHPPHARRH